MTNHSFAKSAIAGIAISLSLSPALAQTRKAPAKPPVAGQPYVLGTKQLPGDFGKFGQEYTIGVAEPLNVTLKGAAYIVDRVFLDTIGDGKTTWFPAAGKKFLRLDLTVKNPDPKLQERQFSGGALRFTVVDVNNENHEVGTTYNLKTGKETNFALKPGQAIDVFTIVELPAEGEAPKLILQREDGAAVIRYDLRGKVTPLPKWVGEGANALDEITGARDAFHPGQHFDIGVRGLEWSKDPLDGDPLEEGERLLVAHLAIRAATGGIGLSYSTFLTIIKTEDGQEIVRETPGGIGGFLLEKRNDVYTGTPAKGEVILARVAFRMKEGTNPKSLMIKDDQASGRQIKFDVSGQDWFTIRDCVRDIRTGQSIAKE